MPVNPQTDVLVTVGAYLSLFYAFMGWLNPGDEVISKSSIGFKWNFLIFKVFEPAYDSYVSQIKMGGGIPVPIVLELDPEAKTSAGYVLNMDTVRSKIGPKTKMMVINK